MKCKRESNALLKYRLAPVRACYICVSVVRNWGSSGERQRVLEYHKKLNNAHQNLRTEISKQIQSALAKHVRVRSLIEHTQNQA